MFCCFNIAKIFFSNKYFLYFLFYNTFCIFDIILYKVLFSIFNIIYIIKFQIFKQKFNDFKELDI